MYFANYAKILAISFMFFEYNSNVFTDADILLEILYVMKTFQ